MSRRGTDESTGGIVSFVFVFVAVTVGQAVVGLIGLPADFALLTDEPTGLVSGVVGLVAAGVMLFGLIVTAGIGPRVRRVPLGAIGFAMGAGGVRYLLPPDPDPAGAALVVGGGLVTSLGLLIDRVS